MFGWIFFTNSLALAKEHDLLRAAYKKIQRGEMPPKDGLGLATQRSSVGSAIIWRTIPQNILTPGA